MYFGNFVCATGAAALVHGSGTLGRGEAPFKRLPAPLPKAKFPCLSWKLSCEVFSVIFWSASRFGSATRRIIWREKFLVIILPVAAFVALGFEH